MTSWSLLLVAALVTSPATFADEKKDSRKAPPAAPPDVVKEASEKAAAGDVAGAVSMLQEAAVSDGRAGLRLGVLQEGRGELDLAIDAYRAAASRLAGPERGEALARLAVAQDARGMADAAESADAAIAADPEGTWPAIALAYRRARQGRAEEAVTLARKAEASGGAAAAKSALGFALMAQGDLPAAESAYREAIAADPAAVWPLVGLATLLRRTSRAAEAMPLLEKAISAASGSVEAQKEMARTKLALGQPREALTPASLAEAMAENDPDARKLATEVRVARSLLDLSEGQAELAAQDLAALRDRQPDAAVVRVGLGRVQIARRDVAGALAELQKAVELDPGLAEAQYHLGYVYHAMKQDVGSAVGCFERAVELEPGNAVYRTSFGAALMDAGQLERAVAELGRVTSAADASPLAWFYLGAAHLKGKKFKEAAAALEHSLAAKPGNAQAEAFLAWSYVGLKDTANFKLHGAKARALGWKDQDLLGRLAQVEAGQSFK